MELDELADEVAAVVAGARHGEIVAVWASGEVTVEGFGSWMRKTPWGPERPVCEFVVTGRRLSQLEVLGRLERVVGRSDERSPSDQRM